MSDLSAFPNLNHLYYFHAVAEAGSIKQAAERLCVTEPTISSQVRQLEDFLGERLFHRKAGGMMLTDAGKRAFEHTCTMFRAITQIMATFRPETANGRVHLRVGVTSTVTHTFAGRYFVPLFKQDGILVRIRHGDYSYLVHDLLAREIDVVLTDNLPTERKSHNLQTQPVHRPQLIAVAPPEIAEKVKDFPTGMHGLPFVHYTANSKYRFELDQMFNMHGIVPHIVGESDDVGVMLEAAKGSVSIAIVPREMAAEACESGEVVRLGIVEGVESTVYAVFQGSDPDPRVVEAVELLRSQTGIRD